MTLYIFLIMLIPATWFVFEVGSVIRDNTRGKGKTRQDQGTRFIYFIAITVGIAGTTLLNGFPVFFFPGSRNSLVFCIGIAIMLAGMTLRYWAIAAEEAILVAELGPQYTRYQNQTKQLIPWVW